MSDKKPITSWSTVRRLLRIAKAVLGLVLMILEIIKTIIEFTR